MNSRTVHTIFVIICILSLSACRKERLEYVAADTPVSFAAADGIVSKNTLPPLPEMNRSREMTSEYTHIIIR